MRADVIVLALAVALTVVSARQPQQPPAQQQPVFRAGTNLVEVDLYPTREGRIVEGLTAADVEVLENGVPQGIEDFTFVRVEPYALDSELRDPNSTREMLERAADPRNRLFVLYLDRYHVRSGGSHRARSVLVDLLQRILAPNDLFGAITTGIPVSRLTFGRRTETIEQVLTRYWWDWPERSSPRREEPEDRLAACFEYTIHNLERWGQDEAVARPLMDLIRARRREDEVLTHLEDLVRHLGSIRETRKALLVVTEGWILFEPDAAELPRATSLPADRPFVGARNGVLATGGAEPNTVTQEECNREFNRLFNLRNATRFRELMRLANQHNVTFYPVNPSGLQVFDSAPNERVRVDIERHAEYVGQEMGRVRERQDALETIAENTDGLAVIDNDLRAGLKRIADDVSAYYVLTYTSTDAREDGAYRTIEVRVKRPDVRVRARRGYRAPTAASPRVVGTAADGSADVTEAFAVLSRLRRDVTLFAYGVAGAGEVVTVVELPAERAMRATGPTPVTATLVSANGAELSAGQAAIAPGTRGGLVRLAVPTGAAGPWRVNLRVGSGRDESRDTLTVTPPAGMLAGEAVVFRATPSPRSPLMPAADYQFRRTERVHVEWAKLAEIDRREARLLGRNGEPLPVPVTVTERDADGRAVLAADVNLAPLTDGEYAIELTVGAGALEERRVVAIRVSR